MAEQSKQTPLVELLDAVPEDVRIGVQDDDEWHPGTTWHPVGRLCHEAAAELRRLHDEVQMLDAAYQSACKIINEQDKKLAELEAVNAELLEALRNIEVSTHDAMTAALARAALAKAEGSA